MYFCSNNEKRKEQKKEKKIGEVTVVSSFTFMPLESAAKKKGQFYIIFNLYRKQIGETDFEQAVGINRLRHYWRNKTKSLLVCPVFIFLHL
jgi:hypothetical protein